MTTITIETRRPAMTSNDQRKWHWSRVRREKAGMQRLVWAAAKQARIRPLTSPVTVLVTWYAPNAIHRDSDSLGPFLKAALDGLVDAGVIPDDDSRYVRSSKTAVEIDRERPRIDITITAEEAQQ